LRDVLVLGQVCLQLLGRRGHGRHRADRSTGRAVVRAWVVRPEVGLTHGGPQGGPDGGEHGRVGDDVDRVQSHGRGGPGIGLP
jgi:hypothetical protein